MPKRFWSLRLGLPPGLSNLCGQRKSDTPTFVNLVCVPHYEIRFIGYVGTDDLYLSRSHTARNLTLLKIMSDTSFNFFDDFLIRLLSDPFVSHLFFVSLLYHTREWLSSVIWDIFELSTYFVISFVCCVQFIQFPPRRNVHQKSTFEQFNKWLCAKCKSVRCTPSYRQAFLLIKFTTYPPFVRNVKNTNFYHIFL